MTVRIAAVLACYNRVDKTLACLESLRRQQGHDAVIDPYVLDDASPDGTADAVCARYPEATVLHGNGSLFWTGGMRRALEAAFARDYDYYLWLNDDTKLDDGAVATLLATARELAARGEPPSIVVGSVRDPETGVLTYGGRWRPDRRRPLQFVLVPPTDRPQPVETMNGNVVLVPRAVVGEIGNIDAAYVHSMGDQDYGLRARQAGCGVWIAPGTVATCSRNPEPVYGRKPLSADLRGLWSVKGLPPSSWATYTRRWAGPLWPLYWVSPYLRRGLQVLSAHARRFRAATGDTLPQAGVGTGTADADLQAGHDVGGARWSA
jgi:GT2 family glycosyltransferase